MEIERKFLVRRLPEEPPVKAVIISQSYVSTDPVIRIRRTQLLPPKEAEIVRRTGGTVLAKENKAFLQSLPEPSYRLTLKGSGMVAREEYELSLGKSQYKALKRKREGQPIRKIRYNYPLENGLTAEVDVFGGHMKGLVMAEVEFPDLASSEAFVPPEWFGEEVSLDKRFHNSHMIDCEPYINW